MYVEDKSYNSKKSGGVSIHTFLHARSTYNIMQP